MKNRFAGGIECKIQNSQFKIAVSPSAANLKTSRSDTIILHFAFLILNFHAKQYRSKEKTILPIVHPAAFCYNRGKK